MPLKSQQVEARGSKTFTPLTATDQILRCSYLFPSSMQCFRNGEWKVVDRASGSIYQLCTQHCLVAKALDSGQMTSTGDQKQDQRLPVTMNDDGSQTEATKDVNKRNYAGAFNTQEVQPGT